MAAFRVHRLSIYLTCEEQNVATEFGDLPAKEVQSQKINATFAPQEAGETTTSRLINVYLILLLFMNEYSTTNCSRYYFYVEFIVLCVSVTYDSDSS